MTFKNGLFLPCLACKNVPKYHFIVFFEQLIFAKKNAPPQNDNFSHFAKHRFIKRTFCCNPPFDQKFVFVKLFVLKPKNIDVEQKT